MTTHTIFISYSQKDEAWKDRLMSHLGVLQATGPVIIESWHDQGRDAEESWLEEIEGALNRAAMMILLISADFLSSDFIMSQEMPMLLKHREKEGLFVLPVIVRPCAWLEVPWLRQMQVVPEDGRPLFTLNEVEIEEELAGITENARTALKIASMAEESKTPGTLSFGIGAAELSQVADFFISHSHDDADFAEVLKNRIEEAGFTAWIDVERLDVGMDWRQGIDQAIKDCAALIAVMTPEARASEYVTYEWAFAWGAGIPVIPILREETQLHPRLETLQYLDFTNRRARPWPDLIEALQAANDKKQES